MMEIHVSIFYDQLFTAVEFTADTKKILREEKQRPAFIGRHCTIFWDKFQTEEDAISMFTLLFSKEKMNTILLKNAAKMFYLFNMCRLQIASIFTNDKDISDFKNNVSTWYNLATHSIFQVTGKETAYAHILAKIVPNELCEWYKESGLGYGVFSMQGAEHVNKLTKTLIRGYTNNHYDKKCNDGSDNDAFVTILQISRFRFFVQHHKPHTTKLSKDEVKREKFILNEYHTKQDAQ